MKADVCSASTFTSRSCGAPIDTGSRARVHEAEETLGGKHRIDRIELVGLDSLGDDRGERFDGSLMRPPSRSAAKWARRDRSRGRM